MSFATRYMLLVNEYSSMIDETVEIAYKGWGKTAKNMAGDEIAGTHSVPPKDQYVDGDYQIMEEDVEAALHELNNFLNYEDGAMEQGIQGLKPILGRLRHEKGEFAKKVDGLYKGAPRVNYGRLDMRRDGMSKRWSR